MMDEKIRNIMKQESEIPDVVIKRMEDTFEHLAGMKKENKRNKKIYLFERSYIKVAAITLVCILSLGTTAYAAAKYFGLVDFFGKKGLVEYETTEKLTQEKMAEQGYSASNEYATYTLKEALVDKELIYMVVEVAPKSDSYLLAMQDCSPEDSVMNLFIDGVTEGSVQEYADEHGKELVLVGMGLFKDEELISCVHDAKGTTDGKLYYCITATNGFGVSELDLKFTGSARLSSAQTMEDISRCSMDITLRDYSSQEEKAYMPVMENEWRDSGFDLDTIVVKETELGVYATYVYKVEQLKEDQYIGFILSDTGGNKFDYMPYYINGGEEILDNGYHKVTYAYQKPKNVSDLHLYISGVAEELDEIPVELTIIE